MLRYDYKGRIKILMYEDIRLKDYVVVTGFPGFGWTGYLATKYIVDSLKMTRIGIILPRYLPEHTTISDYGIVMPFEIFASNKHKLCVVVNHGVPHDRERSDYARVIIEWLKNEEIRELILIGGLDKRFKVEGEAASYRWLSTSHSKTKLSAPLFEKGLYIIGPLALMLMYAEVYELPAIVLLPYADPGRPDPRAAAVAVEEISKIIGVEIDVKPLYIDAERIEKEIAEVVKYHKKLAERAKETVYM